MKLSPQGLKLISLFEGCVLHVYNDKAKSAAYPKGHATIGYGHLLHKGEYTKKDPQVITQQQAEDLLREDAAKHEHAVNFCVKVPLTQNQFDALVSLSFNVGTGLLEKPPGKFTATKEGFAGSSLVKAINAGICAGSVTKIGATNVAEIRRLFGLWNKSGGKVDKGLVGRRNSEAIVFLTPDSNPGAAK